MAKKIVDPMKAAMSEYFRALGSQGGKIGGKARWSGISAKDRSAAMQKLVAVRQAKARAGKAAE